MYLIPRAKLAVLAFPATGSTAFRELLRRDMHGEWLDVGGHHGKPSDNDAVVQKLDEHGVDQNWDVLCVVRPVVPWFESMWGKSHGLAHVAPPLNVAAVNRVCGDGRWFRPHQRDPFGLFTQYASHVLMHEPSGDNVLQFVRERFERQGVDAAFLPAEMKRRNVRTKRAVRWTESALRLVLNRFGETVANRYGCRATADALSLMRVGRLADVAKLTHKNES